MNATIIADAVGPDGTALPALFTGPGAWDAARAWAVVLVQHREALEARGRAHRDGRRQLYRRRMSGKGEGP